MRPRELTLVHLQSDQALEARVRSGGSDVIVLEAPGDLAEDLRAQGALFATTGMGRDFRRRYYEALRCMFDLNEQAEMTSEASAMVRATGLRTAVRTWREAEMLVELARWAANQSEPRVRLVIDSERGLESWGVLHSVEKTLSLSSVELVDMRSSTSTSFRDRVKRRLDRKSPDWRESRRLVENALGRLRDSGRRTSARGVPTVILISDGGERGWRRLHLIYDALQERADVVVATTQFSLVERLRGNGVPAHLIAPRRVGRQGRREVARYLAALPIDLDFFGDHPAPEAAAEALRRMLIQRVRVELLARTAGTVAFVRAVARESATGACIVSLGSDYSATLSAATIEAKRWQIPVVLLQHGLIDYSAPELPLYPPLDEFIVWGDLTRDNLLRSDLPATIDVVALGDPLVEDLLSGVGRSHPQVDAESHRGDVRRKVLVVFGRPSKVVRREAFERAAQEVYDTASAMPELLFVVKRHPGDRSGFWPGLFQRRPLPNVEVVDIGDFYDLLFDSWVVVTMHSTAGSEALCVGKPVVAVDIRDTDDDALRDPDYVTFGAAYMVKAPGRLQQTLRQIRAAGPDADPLMERRQEYGGAFLNTQPIPAAERIADHLTDLATHGKQRLHSGSSAGTAHPSDGERDD